MRYLPAILITILLSLPAMSVEVFRYRGAAMDGGTLEYIFETDEQDVPKTVSKERAAEIAADFVTTFYHAQIGALETQEFRTQPVPFWLVCTNVNYAESAHIIRTSITLPKQSLYPLNSH